MEIKFVKTEDLKNSRKGRTTLKLITKPRVGWEASAKEMSAKGDDHLLIDDVFEGESFEEYQ